MFWPWWSVAAKIYSNLFSTERFLDFSDGHQKLLHAVKSRAVIHTSKTQTPLSLNGLKRAKKAWEPQWETRL